MDPRPRLTSYSSGGGCACKLPPGELRELVTSLGPGDEALLVGADTADDAAVMALGGPEATVVTADFFSPVVDDAGDWGRIAAANALSDVYAMGGTPRLAVNLLTWPRGELPLSLAAEVLAGAQEVCRQAGCAVGGGHSVSGPEPLFGMAVVGTVDPARLIRVDRAQPGQPLTLTKPLGVGILNARHKATGETFPEAVRVMTTLNAAAAESARAAGVTAGTDVTGFGLLGHLLSMVRGSRVSAVVHAGAVPVVEGARESLAAGYVPGGSRRNLDWVREALRSDLPEEELLLLADAQTSGGLLVAGEVPGYPVVGEVVAAGGASTVTVRG
jgi:selenide, water dikinase